MCWAEALIQVRTLVWPEHEAVDWTLARIFSIRLTLPQFLVYPRRDALD